MEQLESPLSQRGTWRPVRAVLWFCTQSVNHRNCFWRKSLSLQALDLMTLNWAQ